VKIAFSRSAAATFALGPLTALCGAASADATQLTAEGGKETRLAFISEVNPDCSFGGLPTVQIVGAAEHGQIDIRTERRFPSFEEGNPRFGCNRWRAKGIGVYYTPDEGFLGDDSVTLRYQFESGGGGEADYAITVK